MQMVDLEGTKHFAQFEILDSTKLNGEFTLKGAESYVRLYSTVEFKDWTALQKCLLGTIPDGTKVSFIENSPRLRGKHFRAEGVMHYIEFRPRYVLLGNAHCNEKTAFTSARLLVDDAATIFHDTRAFGYAKHPEQHIQSILITDQEPGQDTILPDVDPAIAYFTGKYEIFSSPSDVGTVSASHRISYSFGTPVGVSINTEIISIVDFGTAIPLPEVITYTHMLLRFLEIVAGRRQNILEAQVFIPGLTPKALDIYLCMRPGRTAESKAPSAKDLPLNGGLDPEGFALVLTRWVGMDQSRRDARERFTGIFLKGHAYDIDRLVGAANMFDILPDEAVPQVVSLTPELRSARENAKQLFKHLPNSPERDSALSALGRLGRNSLKQKVRYRAGIVNAAASGHFADLELVVDEAVNCRNHYVHGSYTKINYSECFHPVVHFLTDTLEFVFAASEFIEAGWKFDTWTRNGTAMSHPWGRYVVNYRTNLAALRARLPS
ncbi:HEPN domain-containing protein [Muricoccus nepalensis]|uniref:HEPN domain-containing protein n=1 Tax=Muricoccus nepalensis TaxID=1854500 RepID=UPI00112E237A|nr:HEPN domain-containing protein [Roseomonas nepalensis]